MTRPIRQPGHDALRPHVCIIVTSAQTATTFLRGYLAHYRQNKWKVTLITGPGQGLEELAVREGVNLHLVSIERDPAPLQDFASFISVLRALRTLKPEAVVYATPKASLLSAVSARILGIPVRVYEQWGLRLETTRGAKRLVLTALERLTIAMSTAVLPNSPSLADRLRELGLMGKTPVHVLGHGSSHGVDTSHFSTASSFGPVDPDTADYLANNTGLIVGYVGRMHSDKGIDTLLDAVSLCRDRGVPVRLLLIGGQDGTLQAASRLAELGHTVGEVADPRPYYAVMDVLVLVSRREGFPNVVLEAASMGVPAVVSDATGVVDSVCDRKTGLTVPVDDSVALANSLSKLSGAPDQLGMMGIEARNRAVRDFNQTEIWTLHEAFVRSQVRSTHVGQCP